MWRLPDRIIIHRNNYFLTCLIDKRMCIRWMTLLAIDWSWTVFYTFSTHCALAVLIVIFQDYKQKMKQWNVLCLLYMMDETTYLETGKGKRLWSKAKSIHPPYHLIWRYVRMLAQRFIAETWSSYSSWLFMETQAKSQRVSKPKKSSMPAAPTY